MIYELGKKYPDYGGELVKFYYDKYNKILSIENFIKLPPIYHISVIKEFLQTKNVGFLTDLHNVNIYYIDPRLNANAILAKFNKDGVLTDIIEHINFTFENGFKKLVDADVYAINYIFENILIPF